MKIQLFRLIKKFWFNSSIVLVLLTQTLQYMKTLVIKDSIDEKMLHEKLSAVGYSIHDVPVTEDMHRILWMSEDEKTAINYIDDKLTKVRYLLVRGKSAKEMTKTLSKGFPVWKRDDLLKHALLKLIDGTEEEIARVAMEIAADMDEYDAASAGVLTTFLNMDEVSTRLAGARALRARPWMIFYSTAEELSNDSHPEIAAIGAEMLARIKELNDL